MKGLLYLVIFLVFWFNQLAYGLPKQNSLNLNSGKGTPITTMTTEPMSKGSWSISPRSEYYRSQPLSDSKLLESINFESQTATIYNYLTVGYGVSKDFYIGTVFSHQEIYNVAAALADENQSEIESLQVRKLGNSGGIADTNFFGVFRLFKQSKRSPVSTSVLFGIAAPTGRTKAKTNQGFLFSPADQAGTGAWEPTAGIILTKQIGNLRISTSQIYIKGTKGAQNTILGDYFDYNYAVIYHLDTRLKSINIDGMIELNGENATKNRTAHIKDPNSGGNSIFLTPGLRLNIANKVSCYLGVGYPIFEKLNGTQVISRNEILGGIDVTF